MIAEFRGQSGPQRQLHNCTIQALKGLRLTQGRARETTYKTQCERMGAKIEELPHPATHYLHLSNELCVSNVFFLKGDILNLIPLTWHHAFTLRLSFVHELEQH